MLCSLAQAGGRPSWVEDEGFDTELGQAGATQPGSGSAQRLGGARSEYLAVAEKILQQN